MHLTARLYAGASTVSWVGMCLSRVFCVVSALFSVLDHLIIMQPSFWACDGLRRRGIEPTAWAFPWTAGLLAGGVIPGGGGFYCLPVHGSSIAGFDIVGESR